MGNNKLGGFGWCFGVGVGQEIYNAFVFQMSYTGNNRDGKGCYLPAQLKLVEDEKICIGASSPNYDHRIIGLLVMTYFGEPGRQVYCIGFALDRTIVGVNLKLIAKLVGTKGMDKILVAGR